MSINTNRFALNRLCPGKMCDSRGLHSIRKFRLSSSAMTSKLDLNWFIFCHGDQLALIDFAEELSHHSSFRRISGSKWNHRKSRWTSNSMCCKYKNWINCCLWCVNYLKRLKQSIKMVRRPFPTPKKIDFTNSLCEREGVDSIEYSHQRIGWHESFILLILGRLKTYYNKFLSLFFSERKNTQAIQFNERFSFPKIRVHYLGTSRFYSETARSTSDAKIRPKIPSLSIHKIRSAPPDHRWYRMAANSRRFDFVSRIARENSGRRWLWSNKNLMHQPAAVFELSSEMPTAPNRMHWSWHQFRTHRWPIDSIRPHSSMHNCPTSIECQRFRILLANGKTPISTSPDNMAVYFGRDNSKMACDRRLCEKSETKVEMIRISADKMGSWRIALTFQHSFLCSSRNHSIQWLLAEAAMYSRAQSANHLVAKCYLAASICRRRPDFCETFQFSLAFCRQIFEWFFSHSIFCTFLWIVVFASPFYAVCCGKRWINVCHPETLHLVELAEK